MIWVDTLPQMCLHWISQIQYWWDLVSEISLRLYTEMDVDQRAMGHKRLTVRASYRHAMHKVWKGLPTSDVGCS